MFYVYELVDPRDGVVFYVGKGTGKRSKAHIRQAKKGLASKKCDRIRNILEAGLEVQDRIVREFDDEAMAYRFEKRLIDKIGLESLTNIAPGGGGIRTELSDVRSQAKAGIKAMAGMARQLTKRKDLRFWSLGAWRDFPRETAMLSISNGIAKAEAVLGPSACIAEFLKYNVVLRTGQNNAV